MYVAGAGAGIIAGAGAGIGAGGSATTPRSLRRRASSAARLLPPAAAPEDVLVAWYQSSFGSGAGTGSYRTSSVEEATSTLLSIRRDPLFLFCPLLFRDIPFSWPPMARDL